MRMSLLRRQLWWWSFHYILQACWLGLGMMMIYWGGPGNFQLSQAIHCRQLRSWLLRWRGSRVNHSRNKIMLNNKNPPGHHHRRRRLWPREMNDNGQNMLLLLLIITTNIRSICWTRDARKLVFDVHPIDQRSDPIPGHHQLIRIIIIIIFHNYIR